MGAFISLFQRWRFSLSHSHLDLHGPAVSKSVQALTSFAEESLGRSILTFQGLLLDPTSGAVKKCECLFDCSDMCEQYLRSHFDFRVNDERFFFWDGKIRRGEKESIGSCPNTWRVYTLYITYYIWYIIYFIWYYLYIYIYYRLYTFFFISYIIYDIL
jgi:hypothetical protein